MGGEQHRVSTCSAACNLDACMSWLPIRRSICFPPPPSRLLPRLMWWSFNVVFDRDRMYVLINVCLAFSVQGRCGRADAFAWPPPHGDMGVWPAFALLQMRKCPSFRIALSAGAGKPLWLCNNLQPRLRRRAAVDPQCCPPPPDLRHRGGLCPPSASAIYWQFTRKSRAFNNGVFSPEWLAEQKGPLRWQMSRCWPGGLERV